MLVIIVQIGMEISYDVRYVLVMETRMLDVVECSGRDLPMPT